MSAATTPSQLFLQAAGMSSGWAQNAQGMQFARERAGVYDRNAAADDAFRREQLEARKQQTRDKLAAEDAQKSANLKLLSIMHAPDAEPIVPEGPGQYAGVKSVPDYLSLVDEATLRSASPGLVEKFLASGGDKAKFAQSYNKVVNDVNTWMRSPSATLIPELGKQADAHGIPIPMEVRTRMERERAKSEDEDVKRVLMEDRGLVEGTPEWESEFARPKAYHQVVTGAHVKKKQLLAESGIMPTVADPATGQEVPNPQHAAMMKLPAAELEGTLKQMLQTRLGEISSKARAGQPLTPEEQGLAVKYLSQSEANPARTNFQSLYKAQGEAAASELKVIDDQYADLLNRIKDLQDQAYTAQEIQGMLSAEEKQQLVQYRAEKADASRRAVDLFRQAQGVGGAPQTPPQTQPRTLTPQQQAIAQVVDQLRKSLGKEPTREEIKAALQQAGGVFIQN